MFKTFDERRGERLRAHEPGRALTLSEYLAQADPYEVTSEERLERCMGGDWSPDVFRRAAAAFVADAGLSVLMGSPERDLPELSDEVHFKYSSEYRDATSTLKKDESINAVAVLEESRVIGYGLATNGRNGSTIDIIDVDHFSQRSAGLATMLTIGGEQFGVGVAHVVVDAILAPLRRPVNVDATNPQSQYVFKCFGFRRRTRQSNPCLLILKSNSMTPGRQFKRKSG